MFQVVPDNELFVEDELRPTIPFVVSPKSNPFSLSVDAIESTLDCLVPLAMAQATQVLLKRNNHLLTTITPPVAAQKKTIKCAEI